MIRNKPWLLCGDFNEILDSEEHSNYSNIAIVAPGMRDFQDTVRYCSLTDLQYHGPNSLGVIREKKELYARSWIDFWSMTSGWTVS